MKNKKLILYQTSLKQNILYLALLPIILFWTTFILVKIFPIDESPQAPLELGLLSLLFLIMIYIFFRNRTSFEQEINNEQLFLVTFVGLFFEDFLDGNQVWMLFDAIVILLSISFLRKLLKDFQSGNYEIGDNKTTEKELLIGILFPIIIMLLGILLPLIFIIK